jgi:hypothetical protein
VFPTDVKRTAILLLVALTACGGDGTPKKSTPTTVARTVLTFTFAGLTPPNATQTIACGGGRGFPITANFLPEGVDGTTVCSRLEDPRVFTRLLLEVPPCGVVPLGARTTAVVKGTLAGKPVETGFQRGNECGVRDWDALRGVLPTVSG